MQTATESDGERKTSEIFHVPSCAFVRRERADAHGDGAMRDAASQCVHTCVFSQIIHVLLATIALHPRTEMREKKAALIARKRWRKAGRESERETERKREERAKERGGREGKRDIFRGN